MLSQTSFDRAQTVARLGKASEELRPIRVNLPQSLDFGIGCAWVRSGLYDCCGNPFPSGFRQPPMSGIWNLTEKPGRFHLLTKMIPFNRPFMTGRELFYIAQAHFNGMLAGDGPFTARCHQWLEQTTGTQRALLTNSCTAALEMAAMLLDISPGDEVIMPSFTFVSTANAFVLRGGTPVFVDIRPDTLNIDENLITDAITPRTKAIAVVHYGGVGCEMDTIMDLAQRHRLRVVEDAAQAILANYKERPLGSIGDLGAVSFHETKNLIWGEGGALLVNDPQLMDRAEIIREKGTDRRRFFRGEVDKYTWQMAGSSFLPGELTAAFLWAQFEDAAAITAKRVEAWRFYHEKLAPLETEGLLKRPVIPHQCGPNAHTYFVIIPEGVDRAALLAHLMESGVGAIFHYVPLHTSPAGLRLGRPGSSLTNTESLAARMVRLPLFVAITQEQQQRVLTELERCLRLQTI